MKTPRPASPSLTQAGRAGDTAEANAGVDTIEAIEVVTPLELAALENDLEKAMHLSPFFPPFSKSMLRCSVLGWLWLALLWGASHWLTQLPPWGWLLLVLLLAAAPTWGLWLALMLKKRVLRFQFSAQGRIGRWLAGGWWPACKALLGALALVSCTLWQAWFLAPWEWALLAAAPVVYTVLSHGLSQRLAPEFSAPAFAWAWGQRAARLLLVIILGGLWLLIQAQSVDYGRALTPGMEPAALDAAIAAIRQSPSGLVRWGLDSLLALQVAGGALADGPQLPALRVLLLALLGPVGVLVCLGAVLQGMAGLGRGPAAVWRQALPETRAKAAQQSAQQTLQQTSQPNSKPTHAALLALVGVLVASILLQTTAQLDGLLREHESPLALQRLPECERIGRQLYSLGTLQATREQALQALDQSSQAGQALCTGLQGVNQELDAALERYLDWYFSLGAEWGRIFSLLTGDVSAFLQNKLTETLGATPGLQSWMQSLQQHQARSGAALQEGQQRITETLARHHLALDASQCIVRSEVPELPALQLLGDARQRLTASAVAGTGAGVFAAVVAGKAMAKTSMKAASKVLAKAAAKQGLGKAGATVAGAAVGSVVPGIGTAAGAVAGAVVGAMIGIGIDWAALYAEELLTRDAMRADLRAALGAQLQTMGQALGCAASAVPAASTSAR